jgi:transposase-like protein
MDKEIPQFQDLLFTQKQALLQLSELLYMEIRRMIDTINWIERLNRDYKRVLRMKSAMPSPESVIFLLGSVASGRTEYEKQIYQFIYETKLFY